MWRGGVDSSLTGAEDRVSVRSTAWMRFTYQVLPFNHVERALFDYRFKRGLKAGKLAVPLWGKGVPLNSDADKNHTFVYLTRSDHGFSAGKYALIQSSVPSKFEEWDLLLILSVSGTRLNLSTGLSRFYPAGTYVWPLLFGRPIPEQFESLNAGRARYQVSLQYDGRQISAYSYDNFESYEIGEIASDMNGGDGWGGPWVIGDMEAAA